MPGHNPPPEPPTGQPPDALAAVTPLPIHHPRACVACFTDLPGDIETRWKLSPLDSDGNKTAAFPPLKLAVTEESTGADVSAVWLCVHCAVGVAVEVNKAVASGKLKP